MTDKIFEILKEEEERVKKTYNLIASENLPSKNVLKALGHMINFKYAEGNVAKRYYCGNKNIDEIEKICKERAKKLFKCKYVNVQPLSGSIMNIALISSILKPKDKILSLSLDCGGHLTHGSPVNFIGKTYKVYNYKVDKETQMIDYEKLRELAIEIKPKLIISGVTSYSKKLRFDKIDKIAKEVWAYHLADISHIAGLIVAGKHNSPIKFADFITTTTHKTLRGVRGGIIMTDRREYEKIIDKIIFPHFQGGPHINIIAANAIAFKEALSIDFKKYIIKVLENTKYLCDKLKEKGLKIVSDGTDNHLFVIDLSKNNVDGRFISEELEKIGIIVNSNSIPFDKANPWRPSGIRIGLALETTKGITLDELDYLANKINEVIIKNEVRE